jgi:hypothetical protein
VPLICRSRERIGFHRAENSIPQGLKPRFRNAGALPGINPRPTTPRMTETAFVRLGQGR